MKGSLIRYLLLVTATLFIFSTNSVASIAPAVKSCDEIRGLIPANCDCGNVTFTKWDVTNYGVRIICPQIELKNYPLNVTIKSNENLTELPAPFGLKLGSVSYLTLQDWTHTNWSLKEITTYFGINHIYTLRLTGLIPSLNQTLFCNLTNVVMLELNNIGLESISEDLFECLENDKNRDGQAILYLEINRNNIRELDGDIFKSLKQLSSLSMARNKLTNISKGLFQHNSALKSLNLSFNKLRDLPIYVFANLTNLTQLELQGNLLVNIRTNLLAPLKNLEVLNLSGNQIKYLSNGENLYLEKLVVLDLRYNQLTSLDGTSGRFTLHGSIDLTHLHLNGNKLSKMYEDWTWLTDLSTLNLSYNLFTNVQISDFGFRSNVVVDLSHNLITEINITSATGLYDDKNKRCTILLHDNPFKCDCRLYPFVKRIKNSPKLQVPHAKISPLIARTTTVVFEDVGSLKCSSPTALLAKPVMGEEDLFTCEISEKNYSCPSGCSCFYRPNDEANIVNCINAGLKATPPLLSTYSKANHTVLNLQANHFNQFVLSRDSVSDSFISNLTVLNLSNSYLSTFFVTDDYRNIKVLDLSYNNLTTLSEGVLSLMLTMDQVMLHNNPWQCTCDNRDFITMVTRSIKVGLIKEVKCQNGTALIDVRECELCPPSYTSYIVVISVLIVGLLLAICAAYYYRQVSQQ